MSIRTNARSLVALFALLFTMAQTVQADSIRQASVDRAHNFLKTAQMGRQINNLLHFGTTYSGHELLKVSAVTDASGNRLPGEFALVYRFWWDQQYTTELAIFCSAGGTIDSVKSLRSDGIGQSPFLAAQAAVAVVGNVIYEAFKDSMSNSERQQMRNFIDQADVKSLLELQLKLQQALGR